MYSAFLRSYNLKYDVIWILCVLSNVHQILCFSSRIRINTLCKSSTGETCVEIRDCAYFITLLDKSRIPRARHVIRVIREKQCGFTGSTPKVCCSITTEPLLEQLRKPPPSIKNNILSTSDEVVPTALPSMVTVVPSISRQHKNQELLTQMQCGTFLSDYRIMSGVKTAIGEFPWMALIASNTDDGLDFRCAATLINDRYVLTAAHCVTGITIISVRLGEHNVNNDVDCDWRNVTCSDPVRDVEIEEVAVHPNYFAKNFANDIALIRLAEKVNFTSFIQPICLPIGDLVRFDLSGKFAVITGWGVTESGFRSPKLLKTLVPIVPNEQCASIYELHADISVNRQLCAGGYRGRDSCGGDSGGPLKYMAPISQWSKKDSDRKIKESIIVPTIRYVQFGIVSYGPRHCGIEGQPGVYTKVAYYIDWIVDNLRS